MNLRQASLLGWGLLLLALVLAEVNMHRRLLLEAGLGGLLIGTIGLAVSFYSMQVYDRVIPTGALQTLMVLSLGALLALVVATGLLGLRGTAVRWPTVPPRVAGLAGFLAAISFSLYLSHWPVMCLPASLAYNKVRPFKSSSSPKRRKGAWLAMRSAPIFSSKP